MTIQCFVLQVMPGSDVTHSVTEYDLNWSWGKVGEMSWAHLSDETITFCRKFNSFTKGFGWRVIGEWNL